MKRLLVFGCQTSSRAFGSVWAASICTPSMSRYTSKKLNWLPTSCVKVPQARSIAKTVVESSSSVPVTSATTSAGNPATPPSTPANGGSGIVNLTDNFAKRMAELEQRAGRPRVLRVHISPGGCDGFSYKFQVCDLSEVNDKEDKVFEHQGARCVIDEVSLPFLHGCTVDYRTELIGSEFKVSNNPNAGSKCSCGSSFSPK